MATALPYSKIAGIKEMFEDVDATHSGCITVDEMQEALRKKGVFTYFSDVLLDRMLPCEAVKCSTCLQNPYLHTNPFAKS